MKKRILFLFAALLALVILLAAWLFTGSATAFQQDKYYLFVKTGMNFDQLMDSLSSDQVLKSNSAFRWAGPLRLEALCSHQSAE